MRILYNGLPPIAMSEDIPRSHKRSIDVVVEKQEWYGLEFDFIQHIEDVCALVLKECGTHIASDLELTILLSDDEKLQELNSTYSHKNEPTNVLSFCYDQPVQCDYLYLGDIAVSYQRLEKESIEMVKSMQEYLTHLIIHGVLHLLGHDHVEELDATKMERIETKLMKKFGYNDPYIYDDEIICS